MSSKRVKKPPKWEELSREQIRDAMKKKHECEIKAQSVVESLLERIVDEKYFVDCLVDINQCHYEDVVEERVILKLCGYPQCSNDLPANVPKQQYKISFKTNKVYDLTHRKNYCSNYCYRASTHIKNQMLTSPLWYREHEVIPVFALLPLDIIGSPGDAVDLALTEKIRPVTAINQSFTSISDFTEASLNDMDQDVNLEAKESNNANKTQTPMINEGSNDNNAHVKDVIEKMDTEESSIATNSDNAVNEQNQVNHENKLSNFDTDSNAILKDSDNKSILAKRKNPNPYNIIGDVVERSCTDPILPPKAICKKELVKKPRKALSQHAAPIIHIEKCISEWFNLETLLFLFGEAKTKEMVSDKGDCIKEYLNNMANGLYYSATSYDNYQQLCRKLKLLELEDTRYDKEALKSKPTKPLMDYESLKEASKEMELKVRAFYVGETEIVKEETVEPPSAEESQNVRSTNLPLSDKTSQNALRRKIVLTALNKVLPDLIQSLGLSSRDVSSDVRLLVNTFNLKANNILFKHAQWYLIALIMIKLLSIREGRLAVLLEHSTASKHMQLLLLSYGQDDGYLDRLIMWLTDIDRLLNTCDISLTTSK